jgi:vitamin B12 transporter
VLDPNGRDTGDNTAVNKRKQRRQGIELEIKTVSVYNTSLLAGFSFIEAKNLPIDLPVPRYTYDIGISYYNNKSFWAYLKGHYICWDYDPPFSSNIQDRNFIWDINLIKKIQWDEKINIKTFFTIHNIFNASQHLYYLFGNPLYKYPGRWIETGIKFAF